jgi:hypothetical protein
VPNVTDHGFAGENEGVRTYLLSNVMELGRSITPFTDTEDMTSTVSRGMEVLGLEGDSSHYEDTEASSNVPV